MPLQNDTVLYNRYKILNVLAQGGMGAIYSAVDQSLGVQVAVKENLFISEESTRQFRREATILASLRHSNLPRVTDHFVIPGQGQYLVMDFIDGEDLRQRLARQELFSEHEVVNIGAAICDALIYLHSRKPPIVHRDIKPGNIKITPTGQIYLVDFGLAKMEQPGQATTTGAQALTPGYASPEQYGQGTDERSDIYSLGATLYAALTNKVPEDALARAMNTAQLTPIQQINPKVSNQLAGVIEKSMRPVPAERYQNALEFKQALVNSNSIARRRAATIPASELIRDQKDATLPQSALPSRPKKVRPLPIFLGAVGLLTVIAIAVLALSGGGSATVVETPATATVPVIQPTNTPPPIPPTETSQPTFTATLEPTLPPTASPEPSQTPSPSPSPTLASTPLGGGGYGQLAFVSDRSGKAQVYLINSDGSGLKQVTDLPDGACQPAWSPDGQRLVVVSPCKTKQDVYPGSSLFVLNMDGSSVFPLPSVPGGDFDPDWSPDGKQIAFSSVRDGEEYVHIYMLNLETSETTRITPLSTYDHRPSWSPDGLMLAFESTRLGKAQIYTILLETGKDREFTQFDPPEDHHPDWSLDGKVIVYHTGQRQVAIKLFGDRNAKEIILAPESGPSADAVISPDGFWIAYENWRSGNHDIFLMTRNGGSLTRLTDDPGMDFQPAWRP